MTSAFFHAGTCASCCHQGLFGFWMCGDGRTIVLICDECETTYASPDAKDAGIAERMGNGPEFRLHPLGASLGAGRWARQEEVVANGWGRRIEGEFRG